MVKTLHFVIVAFVMVGCGSDPIDSDPSDPTGDLDGGITPASLTLARDVQPILDEYCVRCHALGAGDPHGNPHFTRVDTRASLNGTSSCTSGGVRVRFVVPGRPEDSFLLYKLGATTNLTITGATCQQMMPYGADAPLAELDPQAIATIQQWILDGAQ